ncbi:long-chain acyl-CoA synthetase [Cetobacterium ceti]|uniref:Long-chain acyl-CoA synthetase n=1 Tax=Cetobacterium ceti TaxID=180163 RepID=A0A1T4K4M1_9FUSO|nr:AMP-binding protein [Cetobacterium ceti]SJZ37352.1 long-chain acyl-CoA synthetase [Cetobacterium ceti]
MDFIFDRNKTAVIFKEKEYTYRDLIEKAKLYGSKLTIDKGDFVVIFSENRPEFMAGILGIWEKKGVSVNIDSSYDPEQVAYVLRDCNPKYMFVSEKNYKRAQEGKALANSSVILLKFEDILMDEDFKIDEYTIKAPEKDEVAVMLYTSGTTGNPKGVMLTFDNLMCNIEAIKNIDLITESDRLLALLPFYHVLPLTTTILMPLYFGCLVVILDELSSEAIKYNLKKYEITVLIGVPRVWEMFHKGIMGKINSNGMAKKLFTLCEKLKIKGLNKIVFKKVQEGFGGHIRIFVSGGAKLDETILNDFTTLGFTVMEGYGLTETAPIIAFNRPDNICPGTVGEPIPGISVKIADDGEILVKGRNVMKGYYNLPEATESAIDEKGWFHTGDLGQMEGPALKIIGRKKEMIVLSNGKNINPVDIENEILQGTDLIEELAVTDYDNHLVAIVYPKFDLIEERGISNIKEALKWEIIDKYNVTAPKYRKILDIKIVKEELPKTKLGKLRRFMLKDLLDGETLGKDSMEKPKENENIEPIKEPKSEEYIRVKEYIKKSHDVEVYPSAHIELDLGLDSLDIVELISFVESTFGVEIHEEDFAKIKTVDQLCNFIKDHGGDYNGQEINWKKIFDEDIDYKMPGKPWAGKIVRGILAPIFKYYFGLSKKGLNNLEKGPVIYAGNHQSFLDAFGFSQLLSSKMLDDTYYLAVATHFESKTRAYFAEHGNILLIDINKNLKETLQICAKVLKSGKNLVIFPEGARTRDGELQEFKKAFAILSKELNIPVVPFGIKGAYELMPFGQSMPKKGKITMEVFEKISPENLTVEEIVDKTRNEILDWLNK